MAYSSGKTTITKGNKMAEIHKVTHGWVTQKFDETGKPISQEFFAGDGVDFEDEHGEQVDFEVALQKPLPYVNFEMVQPNQIAIQSVHEHPKPS